MPREGQRNLPDLISARSRLELRAQFITRGSLGLADDHVSWRLPTMPPCQGDLACVRSLINDNVGLRRPSRCCSRYDLIKLRSNECVQLCIL